MNREEPDIHRLARDGGLTGLREQLDAGAPVDSRDPETDRTLLMTAAASGRADAVVLRLLLERGADVNAATTRDPLAQSLAPLQDVQQLLEDAAEGDLEGIGFDPNIMKQMAAMFERQEPEAPGQPRETVLSLAIRDGDGAKIDVLLDAGADIGHVTASGYDALIHAVHSRLRTIDLLTLLRKLIDRGAPLDGVSSYNESALSVTSRNGQFDAVRLLLAAGASDAPLQWTPLMFAIALGTIEEVEAQLKAGANLEARDFWSRTPWLLALVTGDVTKAKLLLAAGADRHARGRCGRPPLFYPVVRDNEAMLDWLIGLGLAVDDTDEFGDAALAEAVSLGAVRCVTRLLDAGANMYHEWGSGSVLQNINDVTIARLFLERGAPIEDLSAEMRRAIIGLPPAGEIDHELQHTAYLDGRRRRFGAANPQRMDLPFWRGMVRSGAGAYAARRRFDDTADLTQPVWCFSRFGASITELPDGRWIQVGGEHEDFYDPDFCIYNDVVVHDGRGGFAIYGYPRDVFPPTDFHTATLVGDDLYLVGSLGYAKDRRPGQTQVARLDTRSLTIELLQTRGDLPGWISKHRAVLVDGSRIRISGGKVCGRRDGDETYGDNGDTFELDLVTLTWSRLPAI